MLCLKSKGFKNIEAQRKIRNSYERDCILNLLLNVCDSEPYL